MADLLVTRKDGIYVDGTLGGGGHSLRILEKLEGRGRLIGLDQDPEAIQFARQTLKNYSDRFVLSATRFSMLKNVLDKEAVREINGILFDLGISSHQIDQPLRGFSFQKEGPLDMRMDPSTFLTAEKIIHEYPLERLTKIFRDYGEERWASKISEAICQYRKTTRIDSTLKLVRIVTQVIPPPQSIKTLARVFQAIRIEVNRELQELEEGLRVASDRLIAGGRICVIAYHSLEDRIVKNKFQFLSQSCICPPAVLQCQCGGKASYHKVNKKVIRPSVAETNLNPRSRSARLRVIERN